MQKHFWCGGQYFTSVFKDIILISPLLYIRHLWQLERAHTSA